jgi:NADPH:quinone reductase-like Zn-dependent oxidoreductase
VVRITEIERPTIRDNELLVKVHATTVNRTDCAFRSAKPFVNRFFTGLVKPRASVLGTEFAGVVAGVGSAVTSFEVGERVFGFRSQGGAHAEYMSIPQDGSLASMPSNLTYEQAAPGTEGSHYALSLIRAAKIRRGRTSWSTAQREPSARRRSSC